MARLTPEQRATKRQNEKAVAEAARQLEIEKFKAEFPKNQLKAQRLAEELGLENHVTLTEDGPMLTIKFGSFDTAMLHLGMETWELEHHLAQLDALKARREQERLDKEKAVKAWRTLSHDDRALIEEHWFHVQQSR